MPEDAPTPKVTTFRVDPDVLDRLDAYAARTRRSRNSAVNYLLLVALDHLDERPERGASNSAPPVSGTASAGSTSAPP